ncbi:M14 family zinc carboxypeptidase [Deinococcus malanensis]|uniref:M14 family zinc carboxypeptidase n=1 Tax=Deinococcus malanensis TaxID=1706855 RepID=UPI001E609669|nr:M14 family zinc carboxypeptidase [Deinococcus malanensis]
MPRTVRVRSAYKTAYFWVTEEVQPLWRRAQADRITLTYPVLPGANPGRFLQEAYPLAAVFEREGLLAEFVAGTDSLPLYQATLWRGSQQLWQGSCFTPLAERQSPDGRTVLAPTGWLTVRAGSVTAHDQPVPTDGELFWDWYNATVLPAILELADQRDDGLVFKNLSVHLHLSEPDLALDVLNERISMTEALTEEIYFGTMDALKRHTSTPVSARHLTPGRIVPVARATPGQDGLARVSLTEWGDAPQESSPVDPGLPADGGIRGVLLDRPSPPARTWASAQTLAKQHSLEWHVPAHSMDGRPIPVVLRATPGTPDGVLVTAGQHANETTGPVAALEFITELASTTANFAVIPLENPDGASLHRALTQIAPEHMHHAARYTSLGDDLESRLRQGRPRWEARARAWAQKETGASLHLNLHGYPSHEWVRPFSGYAPHGFESWALPAGFITILWHWPGHEVPARRMAEAIAQRLALDPEVAGHAARALRASSAHNLKPHYELIHGMPFILTEQPAALCPITVITEAPDETIYGAPFRMFVKAHLTVCAAAVSHHLQVNK